MTTILIIAVVWVLVGVIFGVVVGTLIDRMGE
jgi:uncharacterized protein YneF (UPF0154 family)